MSKRTDSKHDLCAAPNCGHPRGNHGRNAAGSKVCFYGFSCKCTNFSGPVERVRHPRWLNDVAREADMDPGQLATAAERRRIRAAQAEALSELRGYLLRAGQCFCVGGHSGHGFPPDCIKGAAIAAITAIDNATRTTKRKRGKP